MATWSLHHSPPEEIARQAQAGDTVRRGRGTPDWALRRVRELLAPRGMHLARSGGVYMVLRTDSAISEPLLEALHGASVTDPVARAALHDLMAEGHGEDVQVQAPPPDHQR